MTMDDFLALVAEIVTYTDMAGIDRDKFIGEAYDQARPLDPVMLRDLNFALDNLSALTETLREYTEEDLVALAKKTGILRPTGGEDDDSDL